jgi:NAD(P)-dependent dehydrogenase (short-subunit alcohol dehydrogenase family)
MATTSAKLDGRVAIVTGAASAIGRATALRLPAEGPAGDGFVSACA